MQFYSFNKSKKLEETACKDIYNTKMYFGSLSEKELPEIYEKFNFAYSTVDSCLQPSQKFRSGVEIHSDYIFTEFKIINFNNDSKAEDRLALYIKKNLFLVVNIDNAVDYFSNFIKKIQYGFSIEKCIALFLAEFVTDDNKYLEDIAFEINELEEELLTNNTDNDYSSDLLVIKKQLLNIHNYYEQLLDFTEAVDENEIEIFNEDNLYNVVSAANKITRLKDNVNALQNSVSHIQETYSTYLDLQLNKTMKVFTAIATIFLPLTFLTGWFGMNFKNMPLLDYKYGYAVFIAFTIVMTIALMIFSFRKKWWK